MIAEGRKFEWDIKKKKKKNPKQSNKKNKGKKIKWEGNQPEKPYILIRLQQEKKSQKLMGFLLGKNC